jgi:hypothetical protein
VVGKHKGKRPLTRPRHKWKDGIKEDARCGMDSLG